MAAAAQLPDFTAPDSLGAGYEFQHSEEDLLAGTNADAVRCESLRISYKDPHAEVEERLTEDVFLDPRDSWCGAGGILFVTAHALTNIQKGLDKEYKYFQGCHEIMDKCRHDYLKEVQYLLQQLYHMKQENPRCAPDIDTLIERMQEQRAENDAAGGCAFDKEEAQVVAERIAPREKSDEELIRHMDLAGLSQLDELSLRILLKQMHVGVDDLIKERARLLAILGPMDGQNNQEKNLDALLAAASGEGATIGDLILAVQDHMRTDEQRQVIEDLVTEKLRTRYGRLEENYEDLVPKLEMWRSTLADNEERAARLFGLQQEEQEMEQQVAEWHRIENAKRAAWEAKNDPTKKKALLEEKAADTSNMSGEDNKRYETMEMVARQEMSAALKLQQQIREREQEIETFNLRKSELQEELPTFEKKHKWAEKYCQEAEQKLEAAEAKEKALKKEDRELTSLREKLDDEYTAACLPPPKNNQLLQLEQEVAECEQRNAEWRLVEEELQERERRYEGICVDVQAAWAKEEHAQAALAKVRPEKEEKQAAPTRVLSDDPLMLRYPERYKLPEVASQPRYLNMHTDKRARERQYQKRYEEQLSIEGERLLASAASVGVFGAGSAAPTQAQAHVPPMFRRPEDLRVRLAGSDITVGHVDRVLSEHDVHTSQIAAELQGVASQFGRYGAESARLHADVRGHFSAVSRDSAGADSALSRDLAVALEEHQSSLENAEQVWQQAENICERRFDEAEVLAEQQACAAWERKLTAAVRLLYTAASEVAEDGGPFAAPAQNCVQNLQEAEPQLSAAGAARGALWPRLAKLTSRLQWERQVQDGLSSFLRDETTRRTLLKKEVRAPDGEAKRALASMRAAIGSGLPSSMAAAPAPSAPTAPAASGLREAGRTSDDRRDA